MPPRKKGTASPDEQRRNESMRFTTFPVIQPINQKNYYTEYLKREDQILMYRASGKTWSEETEGNKIETRRSDGEEGSEEEEEKQGNDAKVLVIHPGSMYLRIGLASDAYPQTIPNVIAHRHGATRHFRVDDAKPIDEEKERIHFEEMLQEMDFSLKTRFRLPKRRTSLNTRELVIAYNREVLPEATVEPVNPDEWVDVSEKPESLVGHKALKIPSCASGDYTLFWPIRHRVLNKNDYVSSRQCIDDISAILKSALVALGMQRIDWIALAVVLVIPDAYDKVYVEAMLDIIMRELQFSKVCVLQESVCTAFGAGLSSACIIDVGAQTTSIACVEEGICLPESRVQLCYGGEDVTRFFVRLLLRNHFPYAIDLRKVQDWHLADTLKIRHCTANESNTSIQLLHFFHGEPGNTKRFQFKVYDEPVLATMSYFFPKVFENDSKNYEKNVYNTDMVHEEETNEWKPLDEAIVESITRACEHAPSDERQKTMYKSLLLVGGGYAFPGFVHVLEDKLQIKQPTIQFLSPPRDMDPQILTWKGASVFSQLKISQDFWIKQKEWDLLGLRCLQYRSLGYFWNG
ncbi:hypothetical protein T552_03493 [Pneumocystis carinii B80]|uniref:Uncharacterized protein n=1 Tax=Pneumocystis carinii (strain B80) TaxID=1408658 RepID=A0A0W4ZBG0_PNEC8|nr:hypothetical protein T552_03493 [Pneumocystis carinii B80]KTW25633.1 hypothetical protein T552_03493 [Pneumocystis carinii B80]